MSSIQPTLSKAFYVHIGAPDPIVIRLRSGGAGGTLVSFDASLKFTFTNAAGAVTLGVGSGITLSEDSGVANARATIQMSVGQSRTIPKGALTGYELQRTVSGREEAILMGALIGEGGDNTDG